MLKCISRCCSWGEILEPFKSCSTCKRWRVKLTCACVQDLMFLGDFEMAKMRAQQEAKWLMLNLQDSNEFDSHR